ncbi:hypothetical protein B296_00046688 [Ensete ventricosum]|uniref:Uncharacterized protein n=1 Tax=Ensete ventricosum TaxID=4639 RepID=A0A426Z2Z1_ENSVE|nr:hypothetical protein B296_00046688 [Ensete ventricosum]
MSLKRYTALTKSECSSLLKDVSDAAWYQIAPCSQIPPEELSIHDLIQGSLRPMGLNFFTAGDADMRAWGRMPLPRTALCVVTAPVMGSASWPVTGHDIGYKAPRGWLGLAGPAPYRRGIAVRLLSCINSHGRSHTCVALPFVSYT